MTTIESSWDPWTFPPGAGYPPDAGIDITGYEVCAVDGHFGTVTEAVFQPGQSHIIADTSGWIFATTVMLPAAIITMIGTDRIVHVDRTRQQLGEAPAHQVERRHDPSYLTALTDYYRPTRT